MARYPLSSDRPPFETAGPSLPAPRVNFPPGLVSVRAITRALRRRAFIIPLTVGALSAAAYLVAPLIQKRLPDRYVSQFTLRAEGTKPTAQIAGVTGDSPGVRALPADHDASLITVECEGRSALEARDRCTAVMKRYGEALASEPAATSAELEEDLAHELASVESQLTAARERLAVVPPPAPTVEAQDAARSTALQRDALQAQAALVGELISSLDPEGVGSRAYTDLSRYPANLRAGQVAGLVGRLGDLEEQRRELRISRSETNPDIQAVDWEIDQVREELRNILVTRRNSLRSRIAALDVAASSPAAGRVGSTPDSPGVAQTGFEIERLEGRRRALAEQIAQLGQAPFPAAPPRMVVVSSPTLPPAPASRSRVPLVLGGALLGLVIGVALSLREPDYPPPATEPLSLPTVLFVPPILASLPVLSNPAPPFRLQFAAGGATLAPTGPASSEARAFRRELDSVLAALRSDGGGTNAGPVNILAVTSAADEARRALLACNLALASAAGGVRTLLVDADTTGDGVSRYLGLPEPAMGLLQILKGDVAPGEVLVELAVAGSGRLDVLFKGNRAGSGLELEHPALPAVTRRAAAGYEFTVVDAPPALTIADTGWLADAVDAVVLAVGSSPERRIDHLGAADRLVRSGNRVLGAVITAPPVM